MGLQETEEQRELTNWIRTQTGADVYWGEDPDEEVGRFTFSGEGRPDLLTIPEREDELTIIAEVKDGQDSSGVYDAVLELHDYWQQYEYEDEHVFVNDEEVEVDVFVIATQYSPKGHLFCRNNDDEGPQGDDREKGYRQTWENAAKGSGKRPQYAYARTEALPPLQYRHAWYEAEERRGGSRSDIITGIGVLLSNILDSSPDDGRLGDPRPKVQWYNGINGPQWENL